jgi:chromosomal replication initiator protein
MLPDSTAQPLDSVWDEVRQRLRNTVNPATYEFAFDRARPLDLNKGRLTLAVETEFARGWVHARYLPLLRDALFEVLGTDVDVDITVAPKADGSGDDGGAHEPAAEPQPPRRRQTDCRLQPRFTFEAFVTGPSNHFAHAAALAVAEAPASAYNPLFIYGGVGLGKTHLLHAIGNFVDQNLPELVYHYVSVETFTNDFINALRDGGMRSFKDRYRSTDILLIDDIQSLAGREQTQEEFFHTFNALHDSGKQIVISSDRPPKEIATLEDRLRSRFEMGLMADVQPPDLETRIAILQKRAQREGYEIHDAEVLNYVANRVSTNVRALEGALTRVVAHASISGNPVRVDLASEVLADLFPRGEGSIRIDTIQSEVCRFFGVTREEIVSERRTRRIVTPRQVAMYLSRELTEASLPTIGREFGGRDHTTVMYAVQKIARMMGDEGEVYGAVRELTTRLTGNAAPTS